MKRWYKNRGARDVHVTMMTDGDMGALETRIRGLLSKDQSRLVKENDHGNRFGRYLRMFYLRHKTFRNACQWAR